MRKVLVGGVSAGLAFILGILATIGDGDWWMVVLLGLVAVAFGALAAGAISIIGEHEPESPPKEED